MVSVSLPGVLSGALGDSDWLNKPRYVGAGECHCHSNRQQMRALEKKNQNFIGSQVG